MNIIYRKLVALEQELRADKVHSAADKLLPIIKEVKKYVSCEGCTDRRIEPKNCHGTCRQNFYREMMHEVEKELLREQKLADNEFYQSRRQSVMRAVRAKGQKVYRYGRFRK